MMYNPPSDAKMLFVNEDIHPTWSAALLEDGTIINRWDPEKDPEKYEATQRYITDIILEFILDHS